MRRRLIFSVAAAVATGMGVGVSYAAFNPIPITPASYTADVIVEKNATPSLRIITTASVDQGTNNTAASLMEIGFDTVNPANGLPAAGTVVVAQDNANYSFKMPPTYEGPNGILIDTVVTNGTFTLTTPAAYTTLSFMGLGGNGGDVVAVRVNHQDGSSEEAGSFGCPDWFNASGRVLTMGGRLSDTRNLDTELNTDNPRLYFRDVTLANTTSPVTSIDLRYLSGPSGSHNAVLGVSGATTAGGVVAPINVTGYSYDFVAEASAVKRGPVMSQAATPATTQAMDSTANTGNSWYEKGYNYNILSSPVHPTAPAVLEIAASTGLPLAGTTVTNATGDRVYRMAADYTVNNAIYLSETMPSALITFATPTTASVLSFLGASAGGDQTASVVILHQNGSQETATLRIPDWFNQTPVYVYGVNGRVAVDTAQIYDATNTAMTPRLFGCDLLCSASSPVSSVEVTLTGAGRVSLFAASGTTDAILPVFDQNPATVKVYENGGVPITMTASAIANVPISYRWQRGTNGIFVNLVDGANVSGAQTTTLTIPTPVLADDATYRLVATTGAGSVNSATAAASVIVDPVVTMPTDPVAVYQPDGASFPGGEAPPNAINGTTLKYLNFGTDDPVSYPLGFVVTPSMGRSIVKAMTLYCANDAPERDPANAVLEGSNDGGATWSLIYSNNITMPDARNDGSSPVDPIAQNVLHINFPNTAGYTMYRWYLTKVKGNVDLMQIGEVELRGVADLPGFPSVTTPASMGVYEGGNATLTVTVGGTPAPSTTWLKKTGTNLVPLVNGGNISGAKTATLVINPAGFADAGDYVCAVTNSVGSAVSGPATLKVVSTKVDVTVPSDPITPFGDTTGTRYGANADGTFTIDNNSANSHINGGSGLSAPAGFPPFQGPVGIVVTPALGDTIVTGLRIYPATDDATRDPINYILEGSNDGGANYSVISQGNLALPFTRSDGALEFSPLVQPMQELLFANGNSYKSYRLTFDNTRDNNAAIALQVGEVEFLGVAGISVVPTITIATATGGQLTITSSAPGTLLSKTNLSTGSWVSEGPISGSVTITPAPAQPTKYYRVSVP